MALASLKVMVTALFFFFCSLLFSDWEGKNYWVTLFLKGKLLFKFSWTGCLERGGSCCSHRQNGCIA